MSGWIPIPSLLDLLDIVLVASFVWMAIRFFRQTHARPAFVGLALIGVVYVVVLALELRMSVAILQSFFAILVVVLVVVFQQELRRFFERLGTWRSFVEGRTPPGNARRIAMESLVRAAARLAAERTGALVVLPRSESIESHIEGGVSLDGRVSEPLLLSLFDASSPGHDGAVILRGDRVERFAVHLPLSSNRSALGPGGTRHAAALGLSERCDALCIAVSEERGTVSVARDGTLEQLRRPEDLATILQREQAIEAGRADAAGTSLRERAPLDALLAVAVALALWTLFVPGSDVADRRIAAAVEVRNLPKELALESVDPERIEVTLRGVRRSLVMLERDPPTVVVDAYLARLGRRTFQVESANVHSPRGLDVVSIDPDKVKISLVPSETRGISPADAGE